MARLGNDKIKAILLEGGYLDEAVLEKAVKTATESGKSLEEILLGRELLSDDQLGQILASEFGLSFVQLQNQEIDKELAFLVTEEFARTNEVLPFRKDEKGLHIAINDPSNEHVVQLLKKRFGTEVVLHYSTLNDLKASYQLFRKDLSHSIAELAEQALHTGKKTGDEDTQVIQIVNELLEFAYMSKASDLHIEPSDTETVIRFRVDGVLSDVLSLPRTLHDRVVTRLKIMAHLRTDEHFAAQDGHLKYEYGDEKVDIRLSILPTTFGEKVVLRLLSEKARQFSLEEIGLQVKDLEILEQQAKKPWGMILVTGPTGSGKTTSLYAVIKLLNERSVNISTIEDPVEYSIAGVNQVQVNPKTDLTFSKGLRSLVRQDPDIIMVGEIRDQETAGIAVNAALTGHLLLSTLHTNDAATTLPRLLDMDVEPFIVASTVNVVVAQRLVRRICQRCIQSKTVNLVELEEKGYVIPEEVKTAIFHEGSAELYEGAGCNVCHQSGFRGRVGVFEILIVDQKIKKLILENQSADVIKAQAVESGMKTMLDDAIQKALQGVSTIEEVLRVVRT